MSGSVTYIGPLGDDPKVAYLSDGEPSHTGAFVVRRTATVTVHDVLLLVKHFADYDRCGDVLTVGDVHEIGQILADYLAALKDHRDETEEDEPSAVASCGATATEGDPQP